MTPLRRVLPWGVAAVLALDTVGSVAARTFGFDYSRLTVVSFGLYATVGFVAGRLGGLASAVLAGILTGLVDAPLGWAISWLIGPGQPPAAAQTPSMLILGMLIAIGSAAAFGLTGGVVAQLIGLEASYCSQLKRDSCR
jgi:hypothetical protein